MDGWIRENSGYRISRRPGCRRFFDYVRHLVSLAVGWVVLSFNLHPAMGLDWRPPVLLQTDSSDSIFVIYQSLIYSGILRHTPVFHKYISGDWFPRSEFIHLKASLYNKPAVWYTCS